MDAGVVKRLLLSLLALVVRVHARALLDKQKPSAVLEHNGGLRVASSGHVVFKAVAPSSKWVEDNAHFLARCDRLPDALESPHQVSGLAKPESWRKGKGGAGVRVYDGLVDVHARQRHGLDQRSFKRADELHGRDLRLQGVQREGQNLVGLHLGDVRAGVVGPQGANLAKLVLGTSAKRDCATEVDVKVWELLRACRARAHGHCDRVVQDEGHEDPCVVLDGAVGVIVNKVIFVRHRVGLEAGDALAGDPLKAHQDAAHPHPRAPVEDHNVRVLLVHKGAEPCLNLVPLHDGRQLVVLLDEPAAVEHDCVVWLLSLVGEIDRHDTQVCAVNEPAGRHLDRLVLDGKTDRCHRGDFPQALRGKPGHVQTGGGQQLRKHPGLGERHHVLRDRNLEDLEAHLVPHAEQVLLGPDDGALLPCACGRCDGKVALAILELQRHLDPLGSVRGEKERREGPNEEVREVRAVGLLGEKPVFLGGADAQELVAKVRLRVSGSRRECPVRLVDEACHAVKLAERVRRNDVAAADRKLGVHLARVAHELAEVVAHARLQ
mmetsp:Transcript_4883/g.13918  ORF Transcript_4883/g.13918 Transcript_4883/m.13918 type:complete len:548 (+) Transcript_4883:400-2043(+)